MPKQPPGSEPDRLHRATDLVRTLRECGRGVTNLDVCRGSVRWCRVAILVVTWTLLGGCQQAPPTPTPDIDATVQASATTAGAPLPSPTATVSPSSRTETPAQPETTQAGATPALAHYDVDVVHSFEKWWAAIREWEAVANDPDKLAHLDQDARAAALRMQEVIVSWDAIEVPEEVRDAHRHVRLAMTYEKRAFEILRKYYSLGPEGEFRRLRAESVELWRQKDEALQAAFDAYP